MLLYLVRHAMVSVRPELPGPQWHLSPEGRAAAESLGDESYWSNVAEIYTSPEPKPVATAQRIAAQNELAIRTTRDQREVEGRAWVDEGYADLARGYLRGDSPDGWEAIDDSRARVRGCVDGIVERHQGANVGIVSHGLALTLYLSDVLGLSGDEAVALWDSISFPGVAIFDPAAKRFEREFGS